MCDNEAECTEQLVSVAPPGVGAHQDVWRAYTVCMGGHLLHAGMPGFSAWHMTHSQAEGIPTSTILS